MFEFFKTSTASSYLENGDLGEEDSYETGELVADKKEN